MLPPEEEGQEVEQGGSERAKQVRVRTRVVKEFVAEEPTPASGPVAAAEKQVVPSAPEADPIEPDEFFGDEEVEVDPLARVLSSFADTGNIQIRAIRLPDPPHMRGRFALPCTERTQCGTIFISDPDSYINEIRDNFGGGRYLLQVIHLGKVRGNSTQTIADPPAARQQATSAHAAAPTAPVAASQTDAMQLLITQAKMVRELKKALVGDEPAQPPATTPAAALNPQPQDENLMLAKLLLDDDGVKKKALGGLFKFIGGGDVSATDDAIPWYGKALISLAENPAYAPIVAPLLAGFLSKMTEKIPMTPQGVEHTVAQNAPNPEQPGVAVYTGAETMAEKIPMMPQGVEHADVEAADERPQFAVLDIVVQHLRENSPIHPEANWIKFIESQYPEEIANAKLMLATLPANVIAMTLSGMDDDYAAALRLPHALAWIESLQLHLKGEQKK